MPRRPSRPIPVPLLSDTFEANDESLAVFDADGNEVGELLAQGTEGQEQTTTQKTDRRSESGTEAGAAATSAPSATPSTPATPAPSVAPTAPATPGPSATPPLVVSIQDQFGTTLPQAVPTNEQRDNNPAIPDCAGTNWPTFPPSTPSGEGKVVVNPAGWNDNMNISDGVPPIRIPPSTAPGGGPQVIHFAGHWHVGRSKPHGGGVLDLG
jgi:hypothetical protein